MLKKRNVDLLISRSLPKRNHQFNTVSKIQGLNPRFTKLSSKKFHPYLMGLDVEHLNSDFRTQIGVGISGWKNLGQKLYSKRVLVGYFLASLLVLSISGSTVSSAKLLPNSKNVIIAASSGNFVQMSATIIAEIVPNFLWPIHGSISTKYSFWHPGIDIPNPFGAPVKPTAPGIVTEIEKGWFGYGNEVVITHSADYVSRYAHLSKINVKIGDKVDINSVLGNVGSTGHSTGNHLHFEIYSNGRAVNPLNVLPKEMLPSNTNY